jgi:hypothetical protein
MEMNRLLIAIASLVALLIAVSAFAGEQDFVLVNDTGLIIDQFYCSPATSDKWEEDILGVDVLPDSGSVSIKFSHSEEECIWDLMIVDENGDKIYWKGIDLCEAAQITLYYENNTPTAAIEKAQDDNTDTGADDESEDEEEE